MNLIAYDLSLTCTGWATPTQTGTLVPPESVGKGVERLQWIRDKVLTYADGADLVTIEGYAFGRANRAAALGELGGVVRLALHEAEIRYVVLSPSTIKKLATGKGNAAKPAVLVEAVKRLGYDGSDDNESDAMWLLEAALQHYELPERVQLPKAHLVALAVVQWPEIALSHLTTSPELPIL